MATPTSQRKPRNKFIYCLKLIPLLTTIAYMPYAGAVGEQPIGLKVKAFHDDSTDTTKQDAIDTVIIG